MKMIIMRGLPASGKSTRAEEIVKTTGNTYRVNRDKLREMLHFNNWTPRNEEVVVKVATETAQSLLMDGYNVIIDDTNLTEKHITQWKSLAEGVGEYTGNEVKVEVIDMMNYASVEMCIKRDAQREHPVGRHVIMDMAIKNGIVNLGNVVVCDIDGTVADCTHRLDYARGENKNWGMFFSLLNQDTPRTDVYSNVMFSMHKYRAQLLFVSARPEKYRKETEKWLQEHGMIDYTHLIMRRDNDKRPDTEVKSDIYRDYLSKNNVVEVFDDRPSVIRMWREKGLNVTDVGKGIEF